MAPSPSSAQPDPGPSTPDLHHQEVRLKPHARDVPVVEGVTGVRPDAHFPWDLIPRHVVIKILLIWLTRGSLPTVKPSAPSAVMKVVPSRFRLNEKAFVPCHGAGLVHGLSRLSLPRDEHDIRREPEACDRLRPAPFPV